MRVPHDDGGIGVGDQILQEILGLSQRLSGLVSLSVEADALLPPKRTHPGARAEKQAADKHDHLPQPFSHGRVHLRTVHAGNHEPWRIGHGTDVGNHWRPTVVDTFHYAFTAQSGLYGSHLLVLQGTAQRKGCALLEPEIVQKHGLIPFPADDQGLGGLAGRRPPVDQGVEIGLRINPQNKNA